MNGQDPQDKERVQRNVAKMRAAGAPESEVLAYLQQEDSRAPQAPVEPTGQKPYSYGGGIPGLGMKGLTAGLSDEIAGLVAGAGALLPGGRSPGEAYLGTRDQVRAADSAAVEAHPLLGRAAEFGGALMMPLGALGKMLQGGTTAIKAAKGAGLGAGLGGLFAFGNAEGTAGEQLAQTATGAGFGAGVGYALPVAVAGVATAAPAARWLGRWFGLTTNSSKDKAARRALEVALERTGQTAETMRPRIEAALAEGRNPLLLEVLDDAGYDVLKKLGPIGHEAAGKAFKVGKSGAAGEFSEALKQASGIEPTKYGGIPSPIFAGAWIGRAANVFRKHAFRKEAEALLDAILMPVQGPGIGPTSKAATVVGEAVGGATRMAETLPAEIQSAVQTLRALGVKPEVMPQALGKMKFQSPEANAAARRFAEIKIEPPTPIPSSGPVGTTIEAAPQKASFREPKAPRSRISAGRFDYDAALREARQAGMPMKEAMATAKQAISDYNRFVFQLQRSGGEVPTFAEFRQAQKLLQQVQP